MRTGFPPGLARPGRTDFLACAGLVAAVLIVYGRAVTFGFAPIDDAYYVWDNPFVKGGLSWAGIKYAFTTNQTANWHPLTWLSLMLDAQFGGAKAGVFHAVNVLLHAANSALLYLVLAAMTGRRGRSAVVAALFALHPLHVESVAWISERKDVLSTLFWLLTMAAWLRYVERPGPSRYTTVAILLVLGLMAKPMLVTLPVVLLVLDVWPLRRLGVFPSDGRKAASGSEALSAGTRSGSDASSDVAGRIPADGGLGALLVEKIPLFAISAAASVVTLIAQKTGGAIGTFERFPFEARAANAAVSTASYLWMTIWPRGLVYFYPHPRGSIDGGKVLLSILVIVLLTVLSVLLARRRPWALAGWLWYLITLLPVVGLVQVGQQAMADRYTYVPLIGVFVMAVWGAAELFERMMGGAASAAEAPGGAAGAKGSAGPSGDSGPSNIVLGGRSGLSSSRAGGGWRGAPAAALAGVVLIVLATLTFVQAGYWRDRLVLGERTLSLTRDNAVVHFNMGEALLTAGRLDEAASHFREGLRIETGYGMAWTGLAQTLIRQGKLDEAVKICREALPRWSGSGRLHAAYGLALARQGKTQEAIAEFRESLRIDPMYKDAHLNLGVALGQSDRLDEAITEFSEVLRLDPSDAEARRFLELARARSGGGRR
jgi:tetratricopeptide (TPR) repeat protein